MGISVIDDFAKTVLDVLNWFSPVLSFPIEDSPAIEGRVGMEGIGETFVNLGLFDDDKPVSDFSCFRCSPGKLAAMCLRDCDEGGGPPLELGGVGVAHAALLPTFSE